MNIRDDASTGKVVTTITVGDDPDAIEVGQGSVWVATNDNTVAQIRII